jgi:hypothetical protein
MQKYINDFVDASTYLSSKFNNEEPFAAGKIGCNELRCVKNYFEYHEKGQEPVWTEEVEYKTYYQNGIFPQTTEAKISFINELIYCIKDMDCLSLWSPYDIEYEKRFIEKYSPNSTLVPLRSLEPYYSGIPWTQNLKDKKVLVITSFPETIRNQYNKKEVLWEDKRVLPKFDLITLSHQHSPGVGEPSKYKDWSEMIADMKEQMNAIDYDVALIGTGASSLPLVSFARTSGKKAIHLGGALQILFGIAGSRWDSKIIGQVFYNKHWVRVLENETPKKYKMVENGAYW